MTASRRGGRAVAAVVVNFNSGHHLTACVESLRGEGIDTCVIVDNGSTDESRQAAGAAPVRWIDSGSNLGYGAAANLGVSAIADPSVGYFLICNPDITVVPGAVAALVGRIESAPQIGVVGPRLLNPDGSLYPSARTFPDLVDAMGHGMFGHLASGNRWTRRYRLLDWDHRAAAAVDWVSGACFLVRRDVWEAVQGFDDSYFMYMEDVDLCWRISRRGWSVWYEPAAEVVHVQGVSANQHPYRMLTAHHSSMWRFAWRTTAGTRRGALPVVAGGLVGRLAVQAARHRFAGSTRERVPGPLP